MDLDEEKITFEPTNEGKDLVLTDRDHDLLVDLFWQILTEQ